MAASDQPTPPALTRRRHRWTWVTVVTIGLVSGSALIAVPAIAQNDPDSSDPATVEKVVVCESGVVDSGDGIRTSSMSAERVPADAPVPDGCRVAP